MKTTIDFKVMQHHTPIEHDEHLGVGLTLFPATQDNPDADVFNAAPTGQIFLSGFSKDVTVNMPQGTIVRVTLSTEDL